jgi:Leucine rich repeat variant
MATSEPRTGKFGAAKIFRGTQAIFGERKHLLEVLRSVKSARIARSRKQREIRALSKLIAARTEELNRITPAFDRKFKKAQDPQTSARDLQRISSALAPEDYLMARVVTEHAQAPAELLARMAAHPYAAVRENVARHPHTPPEILRQLAEEASEPLWFLVACNPSTPSDLRESLRARMREISTT